MSQNGNQAKTCFKAGPGQNMSSEKGLSLLATGESQRFYSY